MTERFYQEFLCLSGSLIFTALVYQALTDQSEIVSSIFITSANDRLHSVEGNNKEIMKLVQQY